MEQFKELQEKIHALQNNINLLIEQKDFTDYGKLLELSRELDILINDYVTKSRHKKRADKKENEI